MISLWDGTTAVIKNVPSPRWACDLLPVFGEGPAKMSLVKVPCNYSKTLQGTAFRGTAVRPVCLQLWCRQHPEGEKKGFNVHGTVLVKHCHVRTPVPVRMERFAFQLHSPIWNPWRKMSLNKHGDSRGAEVIAPCSQLSEFIIFIGNRAHFSKDYSREWWT